MSVQIEGPDGQLYPVNPPRTSGLRQPNAGFVTKDSGARDAYDSGARRDTQAGKPRYDLIPPGPLKRLAELMARGAAKYDDNNWTKGMPSSRFLASLLRHIEAYRLGDREEDHPSAVVFNAFALIYFEGTEWDDLSTKESP